MFIVIFEVQPKPDRFDDYLALAKQLKPKLEAMEGFIDNERFRSKRDDGRLLSLSTWRDEKAVVRWRTQSEHHAVQEKGRFEIFADYHLRIGEITADTAPPDGLAVTESRFDETEIGKAKAATITELTPAGDEALDPVLARLGLAPAQQGIVALEVFESIYKRGKLALLASWMDAEAASAWSPPKPLSVASIRHRQVRIIRDYGMFERREAPQFYPDVKT
ncbi:antibiotic biosynthesis monooxygenase family protein [Taklimakanibacter deserti]|uniref:antibiotic biosynthesis monooxygenase family protein n=1 Tax=Taklimakanibacter deserti TaxID=2267839 RepID=UPI000E658996